MKNPDLLFLILTILFFPGVKAQSPWTRLSAVPQENTLNCIQKIPGTGKLIAVGEGSTVMISEDAGESWQLILNPAGKNNEYICKGVLFIDESTGFINGGNETILKTTDGGYTWSLKYAGNNSYEGQCINDIAFVDEMHGFATGSEGQLFETNDAGETWLPLVSGTTFTLGQIEFANSLTGFITCSSYQLLKTTDGGNNWSVLNFPMGLPDINITDMCFISDSIGFISGITEDQTLLFRTSDMGITWDQVYSSWKISYGGKFVFFNELSGFFALPTVVEYATVIITTDDGGITWTENYPYFLSSLDTYSLCAFDQNTVISVGAYGAIQKSTNGGTSWEPKYDNIFGGAVY
ncbi:MAG: YCF48-related protein, partial [Bacteroidales bacterium]